MYPDFTGFPGWPDDWNKSLLTNGCHLPPGNLRRVRSSLFDLPYYKAVNGSFNIDGWFDSELRGPEYLSMRTSTFYSEYCRKDLFYTDIRECYRVRKVNTFIILCFTSMYCILMRAMEVL